MPGWKNFIWQDKFPARQTGLTLFAGLLWTAPKLIFVKDSLFKKYKQQMLLYKETQH